MEHGPPGLGIDQAVTLQLQHEGVATTVQARVRTSSDRGLLVSPTDDDVPQLEPRTPVKVSYADRSGLYSFDSEVILHAPAGERSIQLGPAQRLTRTQRRQYVRLDINLPVTCLAIDEETGGFRLVTARSGDIGGGGVRLIAGELLEEDSRVVLSFVLPRHPAIVAVAKVVASDGNLDGTATVRTAFTVIAEADRERIVGFVFDELRDFSSRQ